MVPEPAADSEPPASLQEPRGEVLDRETQLDAAYPALVRWKAKMLLPHDPQNPDQFCERHAITREELESLTLRPTYADDVLAASIEWSKSRVPEMMHSMYVDGKSTPAGADRFVRSLTEVIRRRADVTSQTQINVFSGMDDDKFARIVSRALKAPEPPRNDGSPS